MKNSTMLCYELAYKLRLWLKMVELNVSGISVMHIVTGLKRCYEPRSLFVLVGL